MKIDAPRKYVVDRIKYALNPSSIAVVGASRYDGKVGYSEFIMYGTQDPNSKCLSVYIEGMDSPEAFIKAYREVVPLKPAVAIKVGGFEIGVKAAFAHTASENIGVTDADFDKIFAQAGAIRATTWQEFLDISLALGLQPPLKGDNVVMITNGGGSGLLSCDHFERIGMLMKPLEEISPLLRDKMQAYMPMFGSPLNPVDISGTAYNGAFTQSLRDPHVDAVYALVALRKYGRIQAGK